MASANKFKDLMGTGQVAYGLWLGIPDTTAAEIVAGAGFDWLLIDGEHAPFDVAGVMRHLQALAPYAAAPLVRTVDHNPALLKQLLDIGAQTLLVPMVDSADQAAAAARAVRYPPAGTRGVGSALARAAHWNQTEGYLHSANDSICLIVQVETVKALENLAEIATVEGVDGVFIGPSDLAASMGHLGNAGHPDVVAAVKSALGAIAAAGKYPGLLSVDPKLTPGYVEAGARFIGVGVDTLLLSKAAKGLASKFR